MTPAEAKTLYERIKDELRLKMPEAIARLDADWALDFDASRRRFGWCDWGGKVVGLSWRFVLINDEIQVGKTIRHEIAHALVGPGHGHDWAWKQMARTCGDDGRRCWDAADTEQPAMKWTAKCIGCNRKIGRNLPPKKAQSCGHCSGGRFNEDYRLMFVPTEENGMTKSFVQILARHEGPWKLRALLPDGPKGKPRAEWMPTKTADPVSDAFGLMDKNPSISSVVAWSESEQQFVLTIDRADRDVWEKERGNWREAVKLAAKTTAAAIPERVLKIPAGIDAETVRKVLAARASGLGYVAVDAKFGVYGKKGFWSWKICKAAAGMKAVAAERKEGTEK